MKIQTEDAPTPTTTLTVDPAGATETAPDGGKLASSLIPLALDVAVPLGLYYLLKDAFGVSLVLSLALSSVIPAVRSIVQFVRARRIEALAILMVAVNVAGIVVSFTTGNPRMMVAKDSVISSVIGIGILISVWRGQPIMSAGLKPFMTKGRAQAIAAWDALTSADKQFRGYERRYSTVWGLALLADCVARVILAFLVPVGTLAWMGTVTVVVAIVLAIVVSGAVAVQHMERMLTGATESAN